MTRNTHSSWFATASDVTSQTGVGRQRVNLTPDAAQINNVMCGWGSRREILVLILPTMR